MLLYLGTGRRRYGLAPFGVIERSNWEFQAVLRGSIAMQTAAGAGPSRSQWLWLSPPGHAHGWLGNGSRPAEVAVFHYRTVPEPLRRLCANGAPLEISLGEPARKRMRALVRRAQYYKVHPGPGMLLCHEHILLELSLMIYEAKRDALNEVSLEDDRRVGAALHWYASHLAENPDQLQIAAAVSVSPSHLRRLFHDVLQMSPKRALDQVRFQRALELMEDHTIKLATVSDACGFESQSAFSRAFKARFGRPPEQWRG